MLSNAREISSEAVEGGKRRVRFADTIKMSTYLVAVVIGPFELTSPIDVDGVPLRIGSVPGRGALTGLAEEAAAHSLSFLRNYFAMPYPADKLDHIGIPDFAAGAMENLGLVTYRETALLVAEESSQVERQRVVSTIAHETAHMWFGDLVTMRWWEGIWLNEAFATFMELLATDAFEPRWQIWTNFRGRPGGGPCPPTACASSRRDRVPGGPARGSREHVRRDHLRQGWVGPAHDRAPPGRRHVPPGPQPLPRQAPLLEHRSPRTCGTRSKSPPASRCGPRWAPGSTRPAIPSSRSSSPRRYRPAAVPTPLPAGRRLGRRRAAGLSP